MFTLNGRISLSFSFINKGIYVFCFSVTNPCVSCSFSYAVTTGLSGGSFHEFDPRRPQEIHVQPWITRCIFPGSWPPSRKPLGKRVNGDFVVAIKQLRRPWASLTSSGSSAVLLSFRVPLLLPNNGRGLKKYPSLRSSYMALAIPFRHQLFEPCSSKFCLVFR